MKISESGTFIDLSEALNDDKINNDINKKYSFFFKIKLLFKKYIYIFKSKFKNIDNYDYNLNKYKV